MPRGVNISVGCRRCFMDENEDRRATKTGLGRLYLGCVPTTHCSREPSVSYLCVLGVRKQSSGQVRDKSACKSYRQYDAIYMRTANHIPGVNLQSQGADRVLAETALTTEFWFTLIRTVYRWMKSFRTFPRTLRRYMCEEFLHSVSDHKQFNQ